MKKIFGFILLFAALKTYAQPRIWGTGGYKIRNNAYVMLGTGGTDSLWRVDSLKIKAFKPLMLGAYTTSGAPSAALFPGAIMANIDSGYKIQYSNGSSWFNIDQISGGGPSGSTDSTIFATLYRVDTAKANLRASIATVSASVANAFVYDGNTKGAIPVFGTNDNFGLDFETNNVVRHRLQADGTWVFGGTTDVSQLVHINGDLRLSGTITAATNSGLSMLSGTSFSSFGAIDVTNAFNWQLQNTWSNVGATRNLHSMTANVTTSGATTQELRWINMAGTINNTAGTTTLRGIYWNPTLTSVTGTTHIAFENTSGDVRIGTTSGNLGVGITPSAKFHVNGAVRFDGTGTGNPTDLYLVKGTDSVIREVAAASSGFYGSNGTLTGDRVVSSGSNALDFGQSGGAGMSALRLYSNGTLLLSGTVQYTTETATDANFTTNGRSTFIVLPTITAGRTLTINTTGNLGKLMIVWNQNSSGNNWSFVDAVVDAASATITNLTNDTVYILMGTGSGWVKIN